MSEGLSIGFRIALIGIGATLALDLWSLFLRTALHAPFPNYAMVGRWIGGFARGRFVHEDMARAPAVASERVIGWTAHYVIGVLYAFLLIAIAGVNWLSAPTLLPALMVGVATAAPHYAAGHGLGRGVVESDKPKRRPSAQPACPHSIWNRALPLSHADGELLPLISSSPFGIIASVTVHRTITITQRDRDCHGWPGRGPGAASLIESEADGSRRNVE
jgi:hypothetical protein